jgi:hypothetical protein
VSGNEIHHAGQKGVAGNQVDLTLQGNEIYANNTEDFDSSWNAGGVKISNPQTVTFAGNTVYDNRGNGLWLDVPTEDQVLVVRDNRVHHNDANGIRSEVTDDDVQIYGNTVWENGWGSQRLNGAGISVNASQNNHVYDNVVAWNKNGIRVMNPRRTDVHPDETEYDYVNNVEVDHNDILMDRPPEGAYALGWVQTNRVGNLYDPAADNRGHDNRYWYPVPEGFRTATPGTWISPRSAISTVPPGRKGVPTSRIPRKMRWWRPTAYRTRRGSPTPPHRPSSSRRLPRGQPTSPTRRSMLGTLARTKRVVGSGILPGARGQRC